MRKVFSQPYKKRKQIASWYGKPPKDIFRYDVIKIHIADGCEKCGGNFYMTPDEASTLIRALSAGLAHYLANHSKESKAKDSKKLK